MGDGVGVHKAVILAAGAGSRMRAPSRGAVLTPAQRAAADAGFKGLMPFGDQFFLDYVIGALVRVGIEEICLVVGPGNHDLQDYVDEYQGRHVALSTALQETARGTADALVSAQTFTGGEPFLVLNSDTYYPVAGLRELIMLGDGGLLVVERAATAGDAATNLQAERLATFAIVDVASSGLIRGLEEKPGRRRYEGLPGPLWSSVNCWRLDAEIYDFCATLEASPRGEFELPAAAMAAVVAGMTIRIIPTGGVLDLSTRADVAAVGRLLPGGEAFLD